MKHMKKDFWKYISLGVFGMLGSAGTILADAFFVSDKLGANALAAMNLATCVFGLVNGTGLLFGIGGATRYTIFQAQGEGKKANSNFVLAFATALSVGLLYALLGLLFSKPISSFLGANADTFIPCNTYLKTILCFSPAFVCNHLLMVFVRNDGNPGLSMSAMMTGSLANIVLDYVFMYPLHMGIFGAAFATGLSALIGISISSLHFLLGKNHLHFVRTKIKPREILQIVSLGIAAFVTEFSSGIVLIVFNLLILNAAGNTGVAAYSVVANLALTVLAIMNGMSHGLQPLISQTYGKGDIQTAKKLYHKGIRLTFAVGALVWIAACVFAPTLVRWFNSEGNLLLQALAEYGIRLYFIGFLWVGYNYLSVSYLTATEKPRQAFGIALFRGFFGIIIIACLMASLWGMTGIWLAFPAVEGATIFVCEILKKRMPDRSPAASLN